MPTIIPAYPMRRATSIRRVTPVERFRNFLRDWRPPDTLVDGVLEGGAALGAAYLGSLVLLGQNRIWFRRVAGNSAGAITAAMVAAGYRAHEIEWLCSAFPNPPARPAGVPATLDPINFLDFLDFPTLASVGTSARRKTLLWRALKGEIVDHILNTTIPVPTRANAINAIVTGLKQIPVFGAGITGGVEVAVRGVLGGALGFLPTAQPKLKDFQLFDTENLRIAFADTVWAAIASVNPMLVFNTQLLHEGSMFEGAVFRQTMVRLLGAKVHGDPTRAVQFDELPIPLAVIGANIETQRMEVYSTGRTPNMNVAEAVRRSMSLPIIFQPRGSIVVDGGLCSNFPAWLFTAAGDEHWPPASIDPQRPKVGLSLDETRAAPAAWGASPAKFNLTGDPPHVDLRDVAVPLIIARLKDMGLFVPSVTLPEAQLGADLGDLKVLEVAIGSALMDKEVTVRALMCKAMFANRRYFDVEIPVLGFHGFDFAINSDASDLAAIAERGWFAARDALAASPTSGNPLITNPGALNNPF
jgi:predicted acylesterase/phospholipase RssA